jgi:putative addiction module killer protein
MKIERYVTEDGHDVYNEWVVSLRDMTGRVAIYRRVQRIQHGNLGVVRFIRQGVWEIKVDVGPGYRVYCAI